MFSRAFWAGAGERAIKTFAQALIAALTLSSSAVDVLHANWVVDLSFASGAALLSVLTSLAGAVPPTRPGDVPPTQSQVPPRHLAPSMSQR